MQYSEMHRKLKEEKEKDIEIKDENIISDGQAIALSAENGFKMFAMKSNSAVNLVKKSLAYSYQKNIKGLSDEEAQAKVDEDFKAFDKAQEELRQEILSNKEKIKEYSEVNPVKGSLLGIVETITDPTQLAENVATAYAMAMTGGMGKVFIDTTFGAMNYGWEQKLLYDRNVLDNPNFQDLATVGTMAVMSGVGTGIAKKTPAGIGKGIGGVDLYTPPLERQLKVSKDHGANIIDKQAMAEFIQRHENGETLSLPRNYNFSDDVGEKTNIFIKNIKQLQSKYNAEQGAKNTVYVKAKTTNENIIDATTHIKRSLVGIKKDIKLNSHQVKMDIVNEYSKILHDKEYVVKSGGEIVQDLSNLLTNKEIISMANGKYLTSGDITKDKIAKTINNHFDEYLKIINKNYIEKAEHGDLGLKKSYALETLYNKGSLMADIENGVKNFLETQDITELKNLVDNRYIGLDKFYLTKESLEKIKSGEETKIIFDSYFGNTDLKEGYYSLKENPMLLKFFQWDINSTTKDLKEAIRKGVNLEEHSMLEVGLKYSEDLFSGENPRFNKADYLDIIKKYNKGLNLSDEEIGIKNNIESIVLDRLESTLSSYPRNSNEIFENVFSTIIEEKSGINKCVDILENITGARANGNITNDIKGVLLGLPNPDKLKTHINDFTNGLFSISDKHFKKKEFGDLNLTEQTVQILGDLTAYKLLSGLSAFKETASNAGLINNNLIRLGYKNELSQIKNIGKFAKQSLLLKKLFENELDTELYNSIKDPFERYEIKYFIQKLMDNDLSFTAKDGKKVLYKMAEINNKAGKMGGALQTISDVNRSSGSLYGALKVFFDKIKNSSFDELQGETKAFFKSNGYNKNNLSALQKELSKYDSFISLADDIVDQKAEKNLQSMVEQFADIIGREFDPYDNALGTVKTKSGLTKTIINEMLRYKRYSINTVNRCFQNATTYYDADGILRKRFKGQDGLTAKNIFRNFNYRKAILSTSSTATASFTLFGVTQSYRYIQGTATGSQEDERVKAKVGALLDGDVIPIVTDAIISGYTNLMGVDISTSGNSTVIGSLIKNQYKRIKMAATSDLSPSEKVIWGLTALALPEFWSRGIDNRKFNKSIPSNINTWSKREKQLWKYKYKKEVEREQAIGKLPMEKIILTPIECAKDFFSSNSDYTEFLKQNKDIAYSIAGADETADEKSVITYSNGILQLSEDSLKNNHLVEVFAEEQKTREKHLKEIGIDWQTQAKKLTTKELQVFVSLMAIQQEELEPVQIIKALNDYVNTQKKIDYLLKFLNDEELDIFCNRLVNARENYVFSNTQNDLDIREDTESLLEYINLLKTRF